MGNESVRVGVVDSGCAPTQVLVGGQRFWLEDGVLCTGELQPDRLGHGSAVLACLQPQAAGVPVLLAQVFTEQGSTSALQVGAALFWLAEQGARVINLSLGLRQDRPVLRQACAEVQAAGVLLCASSPAQGAPVYPASYPGVIRVTGDARCAPGQWSWLGTAQADFGGPVGSPGMAGASLGCAALAGRIVALLQQRPGLEREQVVAWLKAHAAYTGPERRA
ncbi:subtilisin-like serine protease QhpE [Pseudomonas sp. PSKL.D1]|uniref:subtilisin-like serine protease QhpE n=1 Tax=Pseudomonas sp. PSKL.D1 TaxID=3029060 RepID=UPI00238108F0|nr:S8 family serine peptidase [Pseudomonas sp. PSKL.D1]WDY60121.1 S8 family serine peptidase [Pseudomonas sp. PSKL.D1]